jgi:putative oxidoreductase
MHPSTLMQRYPFVSLNHAIAALRLSLAVFFMAHAAVRIAAWTIPQFAAFLGAKGWPYPVALVWMVTVYELLAGCMLVANRGARWWASGLAFIAFMGIVIIHARLGWFVGEHGTGGMEYSLALIVGLLVVAAADADADAESKRCKNNS